MFHKSVIIALVVALFTIPSIFTYRSEHQSFLVATSLIQTNQQIEIANTEGKNTETTNSTQTTVAVKSKKCGEGLLATQSAICKTCNATSVYEVNGKYWTDIPFTPIQKERAEKLFKLLDSTLPLSNFTMGFSDTNICFGSQKIHGKHNLFGTLNALGVYDFSDVKMNRLFDFSLQVMPYNALFWGKWEKKGFDEVFFKINSNNTLPAKTTKDELKLQLQVIDIDTLMKEVRFQGKIDYPGRQNEDFDPFQITLTHTQLKESNLVNVITNPQKNTTVSDIIRPVTSPKFLEQIPSPRGVSNIDNMGIKKAQFTIQIMKNDQSSSSKGRYSYRLAQTQLTLKEIDKISVIPQLTIQKVQSSLTVSRSNEPDNDQTFLFKMQMQGTSILGGEKEDTKKFITSLQYSDSSQQYGFKLIPFDKHKASLTIENIEKYLVHMISAKDINVKAVSKGIDTTTAKLVQKLALDALVIQNPQIEIKYRPYKVIKITGSSSIFKNKDTDVQVLLTNNQGRVEVATGLKFQGQNNAMNALEQVFNIVEVKATNTTARGKNSIFAKLDNSTMTHNVAMANFKTNFQINQIAFIISRNDIKVKDVSGFARINSGILTDRMNLNEGLNLRVNAQLPTQCTDSAPFCFFLKKISDSMKLTLYSRVYNGTAELTGKFKNSMVLDSENVVITDPALVILIKAQEDINLKIKGRMENFKVFVEKKQIKKKDDKKQTQAEIEQRKDKNLKPIFDIEIVNHLNVQLRVIAQSAQVVKAQTSPQQMVDFTQLRLTSIIPKNTTKFTQVKLSGLGVFGQNCLNLPKTQNNTPKLQILEKSSKQQVNKTVTNYQKTLSVTKTLSDNCYASWLQFGDDLIDLTGDKKPAFFGIVRASTFSEFLRPFIARQQKDSDYMSFFRYNFISAISDDLILQQKWARLQFDPYMKQTKNETFPGYRYHAPAQFMGCEGTLSGSIVPQTQKIQAEIDLQPVLIAKDNIKILSINYDYLKNKGSLEKQITLQRSTTHIEYYPKIPHQEQVFIDTSVQMFEVQNTTRITVTRSLVSFDIDQAKIFNGTLPFLVRVMGSYKANLTQIAFRVHGEIGSNQARIDLQNDIQKNLAQKRDDASNIVWMINSQKSKTLSILSLVKKTKICTKESCPLITQCEEGEKYQPLLSCKEFQKKQKCVSERDICPHFKEECVKMKQHCAKYDTASGKCLKEYEVCEKWENTCTSKLTKICTDYEIEEMKDICLEYSFDCKTIKKRSQECLHKCQQGQKLEQFFDQRLKFHISLQNRALSLFQWREYLHYLSEKDQGNDVPLAQIVNVSFDTALDSYKNPIDIEVLIKVQLAFEDDKQYVVIKTSAETLQSRDLLVNQISNAIIKHIAIKLDIDDIELWKNLPFVKDLIQNVIEDKKMLSVNKEITQTQSDKKEHDWVTEELKNMKYNELGQTEGEVITEKLRVKKDGGDFLPNDIQVLMEKIATSKERIIQFQLDKEKKEHAKKDQNAKKEKKEENKDQKNKKDVKKQVQNENKKKTTQQIVTDGEITSATKQLKKGGEKEVTIKNGMAPENY